MNNHSYQRLTEQERNSIEQGLKTGQSLCSLAKNLQRSVPTISREILRNSFFEQTGGYGTPFNNCVHRRTCDQQHLCSKEDCKRPSCCGCKFCFHVCRLYQREACPRLDAPPYVCNGCPKRRVCTLEKAWYQGHKAQRTAQRLLRECRSGVDLTEEERKRIDDIVSPLIKQGQSPWHICQTNKDRLMLSDKTIYKYMDAGLLTAKNVHLRVKVKMKPRKTKPQLKIERACREGRTYRDFLAYLNQFPDTPIVEMDTVLGRKGRGEPCLLTIHFPNSELMLAYLRQANTASSVTDIFSQLKGNLGYQRFAELFLLLLPDNGSEFSNPSVIEREKDGTVWTQIFYCDPNCAYQKPHIENNHRLLRMIFPKGVSLDGFSQTDVLLAINHINSYARRALGGKTPLQMFTKQYGIETSKLLGLKEIPPNDITLNPSLLQ